jgi:hypothetical protein
LPLPAWRRFARGQRTCCCSLMSMPGHVLVLGGATTACEPGTRAASALAPAASRRRYARGRGRGASPGAGRGQRPPNPATSGPARGQVGPPGSHPAHPSPPRATQGAHGGQYRRLWPSDRAAGVRPPCFLCLSPALLFAFTRPHPPSPIPRGPARSELLVAAALLPACCCCWRPGPALGLMGANCVYKNNRTQREERTEGRGPRCSDWVVAGRFALKRPPENWEEPVGS